MTSTLSVPRRTVLLGVLSALCAGCGDTPIADSMKVIKTYIVRGDDLPMTHEQVFSIPYATIGVRIGRSAQVLLVLGWYDGPDLEWVSADNDTIVTRAGRIVRTFGLPEDLKYTKFLSADPVGVPMAASRAQPNCLRAVDIQPGDWAGVPVASNFRQVGEETIVILGTRRPTLVWEEVGSAPLLDWEFTNRYWVDPKTGFVWKSVQTPTPNMPPIEIVTFKTARPQA